MFDKLVALLLDLAATYGLPLLWLGLFLAGLGMPIPEDVFLISGGVLTNRNPEHTRNTVILAIAVLYSGVMVGDSIVYYLGWKYGDSILSRPRIARLMTADRVAKVKRYYAKYGAMTVFIARHFAGIRFPTFLLAGVSRIGFFRYFFWDGLAALISVPLWFWLGYTAANNWEEIHGRIMRYERWIVGGLVVIAAGVIFWRIRRKRARAARPPTPDPQPAADPSEPVAR